jgi:hypothetical protein
VRTQPKRNLVAACYRVHGDDFLPLAIETFERTGTATNLLGKLRVREPRDGTATASTSDTTLATAVTPTPTSETSVDGWAPYPFDDGDGDTGEPVLDLIAPPNQMHAESTWCGCPEADLRPDLLYCASHRPTFGAHPKWRWDRRRSNPQAAEFYAQQELELVSSAIAGALSR